MIANETTLNNEQSPYRIVSYKRPQNDKCKTIQMRMDPLGLEGNDT